LFFSVTPSADLFLFFKAALASNMPEVAFHKQMQKLIGGWYSEGAVRSNHEREAD
jgi:hypothetical protein